MIFLSFARLPRSAPLLDSFCGAKSLWGVQGSKVSNCGILPQNAFRELWRLASAQGTIDTIAVQEILRLSARSIYRNFVILLEKEGSYQHILRSPLALCPLFRILL